jgi:hypothetical protein
MIKISRYLGLTLSLDAPADLLYARKGEATPEYLDRQGDAYLEQRKEVANLVRMGATRPLEKVFEDVLRIILEYRVNNGRQAS